MDGSMARQIEGDARARVERLRDDVRSLEERKSRILDDLRDLAVQLQDLVPELGARPERELLEALEVDRSS